MEYRWLSNKEIEEDVNPVLALHGMALLNINETIPTCQVLGAFEDGHLIQFLRSEERRVSRDWSSDVCSSDLSTPCLRCTAWLF